VSGQDFDFGLGDILQENDSGHTLARGGAAFLAVLFLVLSSITTFGFFSTYAVDIGAFAGPTAAPLVSGAIGVLCLDVAALLWGYVRSRAATSSAQMAIALVISIADLLLALASSALFIVLSTSLETGVRDAAGQLTDFGATVNWFGVGVITAALVGNFASVFAWTQMGADTKKAQQSTELRAVVTAGQHTIDKERTGQIVQRTIGDIRRQLPAAVDGMAARKSAEYVDAKMRHGRALPTPIEPAAGQDNHGRAGIDLYQVAKANNFTPEEAAAAIVGMRHNYHEGDRSTPAPDYSLLYGNGHGPTAARPTQRPDGR
jgi:hypothetical protein